MGGLASVALVIGGDMEATAHQLIDEAPRPPEPRHRQAHDQQERLAPGTAKRGHRRSDPLQPVPGTRLAGDDAEQHLLEVGQRTPRRAWGLATAEVLGNEVSAG
jgi:hypothetical protein